MNLGSSAAAGTRAAGTRAAGIRAAGIRAAGTRFTAELSHIVEANAGQVCGFVPVTTSGKTEAKALPRDGVLREFRLARTLEADKGKLEL